MYVMCCLGQDIAECASTTPDASVWKNVSLGLRPTQSSHDDPQMPRATGRSSSHQNGTVNGGSCPKPPFSSCSLLFGVWLSWLTWLTAWVSCSIGRVFDGHPLRTYVKKKSFEICLSWDTIILCSPFQIGVNESVEGCMNQIFFCLSS